MPRWTSQDLHPLTELLPDHVAPELLWLETKWASFVSFGITTDLLKDVLPIDRKFSPDSIRRHLGRVADRMEADLAEERFSFISTNAHQPAKLPNPEGPITVGIDGGYVRSRDVGQSHLEVTVGKSIPTDRPSLYLGLVQSHDNKPKRRLHEVLKDQGWQENQIVTFMTDGGDTVIKMARHMAPASEHILDWFHITMRITVMQQYVKGLAHSNPEEAEAISRLLRQIKGFLWHGNLHDGQIIIGDMFVELDEIETDYPSFKALRKSAAEFETYIENNASMIPNYAERRRYGERVSTGFVESTVNTIVGKRFSKPQQMRWSKLGAHLLLQARTRTLDGTLRVKFEQCIRVWKQVGKTEWQRSCPTLCGTLDKLRTQGFLRSTGPPAPDTVRRRLATWSTLTKWRGPEGTFSPPALKSAIRLAVRATPRPRQRESAKAVTGDVLSQVLATCQSNSLRDLRDKPILMVAFASGGRRRSEIASLRKEQLSPEEPIPVEGGPALPSLSIHLGRTKTSGGGNDEVVYLTGRPVDALNAWLATARIERGSVFRAIDRWGNVSKRALDPKAVNDIVKQRARLAGLDPAEFSAHGLRSGYLTEAANRGIPLPEAMEQSRHRSVQQASEYYNSANRRSGRAARLMD